MNDWFILIVFIRNQHGAADGDHILVRTNGTEIQVVALEGGHAFNVTGCGVN